MVRAKGGWLDPEATGSFARYTRKVVDAYKNKVRYWITINEPTVLAYYGYMLGKWPPGKRSLVLAMGALRNCLAAHRRAYQVIHARQEDAAVGIAHHLRPFKVCPRTPNVFCALNVWARHYLFNRYFLERVKRNRILSVSIITNRNLSATIARAVWDFGEITATSLIITASASIKWAGGSIPAGCWKFYAG